MEAWWHRLTPWTSGLLHIWKVDGWNIFMHQSILRVFLTTWSYRLIVSADQTWLELGPECDSPTVQHDDDDDDEGEAGEDSLSTLGNWIESHLICGPIGLQEKVKVMLTPHWIAAVPTAPLRRLTHVYILKRKNFRIVFSVSNPFLTLASINVWIFKAFDSLSPLLSVRPLNLFSCFLTSVLCFPPSSVPHVCILSWYNLFCCMKY